MAFVKGGSNRSLNTVTHDVSFSGGQTAAPGNLLVSTVSVNIGGATSAEQQIATPSGWTAVRSRASTTNDEWNPTYLFWKVADGSETGVTLTSTIPHYGVAAIMEYDLQNATLVDHAGRFDYDVTNTPPTPRSGPTTELSAAGDQVIAVVSGLDQGTDFRYNLGLYPEYVLRVLPPDVDGTIRDAGADSGALAVADKVATGGTVEEGSFEAAPAYFDVMIFRADEGGGTTSTIVQSDGVAGDGTLIDFTITPTAAESTLFVVVPYIDSNTSNPLTTPTGWSLVGANHSNAGYWTCVYRKDVAGTETQFTLTYPVSANWHIGWWEDTAVGAPLAYLGGSANSDAITTGPITTAVGDSVIAIHSTQTYTDDPWIVGTGWTELDTTTAIGRRSVFLQHKVATSTSEVSDITLTVGGYSGWILLAYPATGEEVPPDSVIGAGNITAVTSLLGSGLDVPVGTYRISTGGSLSFVLDLVEGANLRLNGTTSGLNCWVTVVALEGTPTAPTQIYVVDAQQSGDDSLANLVSQEQDVAGAIDVRYYS